MVIDPGDAARPPREINTELFVDKPPERYVRELAGYIGVQMPEAFRRGGKQVGLMTTLGFAVAFFITTLE